VHHSEKDGLLTAEPIPPPSFQRGHEVSVLSLGRIESNFSVLVGDCSSLTLRIPPLRDPYHDSSYISSCCDMQSLAYSLFQKSRRRKYVRSVPLGPAFLLTSVSGLPPTPSPLPYDLTFQIPFYVSKCAVVSPPSPLRNGQVAHRFPFQ